MLTELEENHKVIRPYTGFRGEAGSSGLTVAAVFAGGPAADAGLQVGDVVEEVDGKAVRTPIDLHDAIAERRPGDVVTLRAAAQRRARRRRSPPRRAPRHDARWLSRLGAGVY